MKEPIIRSSKIEHQNDDQPIKASRVGRTEKTKLTLGHIRKVHRIKSDSLGYCYHTLGDNAWQILCEIHLHNLNGKKLDIVDIARSMSLSLSITKRYLEILQVESLVESSTTVDQSNYREIQLTEFGQSKVQSILEECTESFTSIFIYSQPQALT